MSCAFVSPRRYAACLLAICYRPDTNLASPQGLVHPIFGLLAHCKSLRAVWLGRVRWAGVRLCEGVQSLAQRCGMDHDGGTL